MEKFTQPCILRKSPLSIRTKLENLGYRLYGAELNQDLPIVTDTNFGLYSIKAFSELDTFIRNGHIDCKSNESCFLALAALRSDSDYMQWFTNGIMWYQCEATVFENCSLFDNEYGTQIKDGHDYHKATVPEILKHFNGTTN